MHAGTGSLLCGVISTMDIIRAILVLSSNTESFTGGLLHLVFSASDIFQLRILREFVQQCLFVSTIAPTPFAGVFDNFETFFFYLEYFYWRERTFAESRIPVVVFSKFLFRYFFFFFFLLRATFWEFKNLSSEPFQRPKTFFNSFDFFGFPTDKNIFSKSREFFVPYGTMFHNLAKLSAKFQ